MSLDSHLIWTKLDLVAKQYNGWQNLIIGGSAAAVLRHELVAANDIDIIQHYDIEHTWNDTPMTKRMWSKYYSTLEIDWHYTCSNYLNIYAECFHKVIRAIIYVDETHHAVINGWKIITQYGAGLINWLHHFLDYGYNIEKTVNPSAEDEKEMRIILGNCQYDIIKWKVETAQMMEKNNDAYRTRSSKQTTSYTL